MKTAFYTHARQVKSVIEVLMFSLVFLIGGSQQCLATRYARRRNTKVVVMDSDEEINKYRRLYDRFGIKYFSLGRRETLLTLCRDASPEVQLAGRSVAGMMAREGAGGAPAAACLAAMKLVATDEYQSFLHGLIAEIVRATGGRPEGWDNHYHLSSAGGMGAGAADPVATANNQVLSTLDIPIRDTFHIVGQLAYTGLSFVGDMNSAAALGNYVHRAIDKSDPALDRVVTRLELVEYPPLGTDNAARNRLITIDDQALRSAELQEYLLRISPNLSTLSELGGIQTRDLEVFAQIDPDREVLPSVAHNLTVSLTDELPEIAAVPSLVRERHWEPTTRKLPRTTIQEIVADAEGCSFDEFVNAVMEPGEETTYQFLLDAGPRGEYDPSQFDLYHAESPTSFSAAKQRLSNLATFQSVIDQEYENASRMLVHCEHQIENRLPKLEKAHQRLVDPGFWTGNSRGRLTERAMRLRELRDRALDCEARLATLTRNKGRILEEQKYLQDRLQAVKTMLDKFAPRGRDSFHGRYVVVANLEDCFGELLRLTLEPEEEQRTGLCRLASLVTLEGLAQCVGSPTAKIEDIARRIVFGEAVLKCPPHGAVPRTDYILKAYCLPPVSATFAELLRTAIYKLDPNAVVVFNDDTAAGITVVRYEFRGFSSIDQIMVGLLRHGAKRLADSNTKALRYPHGQDRMPKSPPDALQAVQHNGKAPKSNHNK